MNHIFKFIHEQFIALLGLFGVTLTALFSHAPAIITSLAGLSTIALAYRQWRHLIWKEKQSVGRTKTLEALQKTLEESPAQPRQETEALIRKIMEETKWPMPKNGKDKPISSV